MQVEEEESEINETPLGDTLRPARQEVVGLLVYLISFVGFIYWLLVYGVNV